MKNNTRMTTSSCQSMPIHDASEERIHLLPSAPMNTKFEIITITITCATHKGKLKKNKHT